MGDTFTLQACLKQFNGDAAGLADCDTAYRRTKCNQVVISRKAACTAAHTACTEADNDKRQCASTLSTCNKAAEKHSIKKGDHSTASLQYYNSNFDSTLTHAVYKPQDLITSQGLHAVVMYYAANAIAIADSPELDLNNPQAEVKVYWDRLAKYMSGDSGMEFALGLIKSILIYQHEALSRMRDNTSVTIITFSVILVILLLQFLFLSLRVGVVIRDSYGMLRAITRFLDEISEIQNKMDHENTNLQSKKTAADELDEEEDSEGDLESEETESDGDEPQK